MMRRTPILLSSFLVLGLVGVYLWKVVGLGSTEPEALPKKVVIVEELPPGDDSLSPGELACKKPVEFMAKCLNRYRDAGIKGYSCTFLKHERINGKLRPAEEIECWFKETPFSVMMHWTQGADRAAASLYVAGENGNEMCVRPQGSIEKLVGFVHRRVDASEAKSSTRYLITEFGLRCGTERTYEAWKTLQGKGVALRVDYDYKPVAQVGGRMCHVVHRHCEPPEEEGLTDVTIYVDAETWFQVGSVLKANDDLIGEYWFKDIKLNPEFDNKQFTTEMLKKY